MTSERSQTEGFAGSDESDEAIIGRIQDGFDDGMELIVHRYKPLVLARARSYFLIGADHDDLVQEGMIGLFKAVRDYRYEKNIAFRTFAEMCVVRQLVTAVKAATRQKHQPLNSYISLSLHAGDEADHPLIELPSDTPSDDPESAFIRNEEIHGMNRAVEKLLSLFERQVLALYLDGIPYAEVAQRLGKPLKAIDNALQRIRRKLERTVGSQAEKRS